MIPGILEGRGGGVRGWEPPPAWLLQEPRASCLGPLPSQKWPLVNQMPLLELGVDYLPPIFISGVNLVLPPVFKLIAPLEGYTRSHQIVLILLRFQPSGVGWGR